MYLEKYAHVTVAGDNKGNYLNLLFGVDTNAIYSQDLEMSFGLWHQENAIKSTSVSF